MVIGTEQGLKADQTGDQKFWKHIYANPLEPVSLTCIQRRN